MPLRMAFIGFRHAHAYGIYKHAGQHPDVTVVAACEEDAETRAGLARDGITITHDSYERMLAEVDCDAIAVGDYFGVRGERALQALERGRHVISDKPVCTSLAELDGIRALTVSRKLKLGCMLDLRDGAPFIKLHELVRGGRIGEVHTVTFLAQHPLLYGSRPMWNFEPGKHGGTINDIAVHGVDIVPWITGRELAEVTAARAWNAKIHKHPQFQDGAVVLFRLDNGGSVFGDVSYLSADQNGYSMEPYYRMTVSGTDGVAETHWSARTVKLWRHDSEKVIEEPVGTPRPGGYLEDFLADVEGAPRSDGLSTASNLESTRIALVAQRAADTETFRVDVRQPNA